MDLIVRRFSTASSTIIAVGMESVLQEEIVFVTRDGFCLIACSHHVPKIAVATELVIMSLVNVSVMMVGRDFPVFRRHAHTTALIQDYVLKEFVSALKVFVVKFAKFLYAKEAVPVMVHAMKILINVNARHGLRDQTVRFQSVRLRVLVMEHVLRELAIVIGIGPVLIVRKSVVLTIVTDMGCARSPPLYFLDVYKSL